MWVGSKGKEKRSANKRPEEVMVYVSVLHSSLVKTHVGDGMAAWRPSRSYCPGNTDEGLGWLGEAEWGLSRSGQRGIPEVVRGGEMIETAGIEVTRDEAGEFSLSKSKPMLAAYL